MCRWLAYVGAPMRLDRLLFEPQNSLIRQSLHATLGATTTNGDGFGLGWYGERGFPGVFRDTHPAWHDANLRCLSEQIRSRLFFAHVRASTGTSTSRENCHPFRFEHVLFMHNGQIGEFSRIRREIEGLIPSSIYAHRHGTTDSEAFFLLAVGFGLLENVPEALRKSVGAVEELRAAHSIVEPFRLTAAITDGERVWALRYASDHRAPSLFYFEGSQVSVSDGMITVAPGRGAVLVLSEPLDAHVNTWAEVPQGSILETHGGVARIESKLF